MAGRKRPKVVLCATLTVDGKLDTETPAVPLELYDRNAGAVRNAWWVLYDESAGMLIDNGVMQKLKPSGEGLGKPLAAVNWELVGTWPPPKQRAELLAALRRLRAEHPKEVLCFGGAALFRGVLEAGLADELRLCVRPQIDARRGVGTLSGVGGEFFPASVGCRLVGMEVVGDECFLHYRVVKGVKTQRKVA